MENTNEEKKELRFSYSALNAFDGCPNRYYLSYIKKERGEKGIALIRGSKLHKDMEEASSGKSMSQMKDHLFSYNPVLFPVAEWLEEQGMTEPEGIELKITNPAFNFTGVIDRIDKFRGGRILIDWKSGQDRGITPHLKQLAIYDWLYETKENKEIDWWGIYYLDHHTNYIVPSDVLLVKEAVQWVESRIKSIREIVDGKRTFNKCKSWQCKFCEFRKICEEERNDIKGDNTGLP